MDHLDRQTDYWNKVAAEKEFTHPFDCARFKTLVPVGGRVLDYGCGYGRVCEQVRDLEYSVVGVDISKEMIKRGRKYYPQVEFELITDRSLPYENESFDAVILFAVLTCIPNDSAQRELIREIHRVLRPGGILYVSDYSLQTNERNQHRYEQFEKKYGTFGVFELPDGAVLRHHSIEWIEDLLSGFERIAIESLDVPTMNWNPATIFQYFAKKTNQA